MNKKKLFTAERRAYRSKFYGKAVWKRIRKNQLARCPLCQECEKQGKQTVATTCDHIDPTWETWKEFVKGPFQSLCRTCHQDKSLEDYSKLKRAEMLRIQVWDV